MLRIFFLVGVLFFINMPKLYAEECEPLNLTKNKLDIVLTTSSESKLPQLYFFSNKSSYGVFIDQAANDNPGASAGWSSYLRPGNWSALLLNKKNFILHCSAIQPGKVVALDCAETITVCKPSYTMPQQIKGSAWLAEDKTWEAMLKVIDKKNIQLSWPKTNG